MGFHRPGRRPRYILFPKAKATAPLLSIVFLCSLRWHTRKYEQKRTHGSTVRDLSRKEELEVGAGAVVLYRATKVKSLKDGVIQTQQLL